MKRILLPALLLIAFACGPKEPQTPQNRVYNAPKVSGLILIDGILDEPDWQNAPLSEAFADIRGVDFEPRPTQETYMKMLWDEEYLYIAGIIHEENVTASLTDHDAIIYKDNDFEVFIDPDGDGRNYFEFETNALGTVMDLLMDRPYSQDGHFFLPWDCRGLRLATKVNGTLNDNSDTDKGWTVEMAIPFEALTVDFKNPKELQDWRINFSRVEWVKPGGPEENWVWNPTGVVDMHQPQSWGILHFEK